MNTWLYARSDRHDVVRIPRVWLTLLLSLLVHAAALWLLVPRLHNLTEALGETGKAASSLAVDLQARPMSPAVSTPALPVPPATAIQSAPKPRAPPTKLAKRQPPPPVIALDKRESQSSAPATPSPIETPAPTVAPKPAEPDLASYIAARKRERGEPQSSASTGAGSNPAAESDIERRNRIVAANLGLNTTPSFGYDPKSAGGIFQIVHIGYDDADFYFLGLNKDIGRIAKQLIEVRRGSNSDIRIAIARKMIAIIRDYASGDFIWVSRRGPVTMSARARDNDELEQFILSDLFPELRLR